MKLNKGVNPGNNKPIYFLTGNTYPIRDKIKQLGFRWYDNKQGNKFWWAYPEVITSYGAESLRRLGFDVSEYGELGSSSEPVQQNQNIPEPTTQPVKPTVQVTDQSFDNSGSKSDWYGFPLKENIYTGKISVIIDDQSRELTFQVDRDFEARGVPAYRVHVKNERGELVKSFDMPSLGKKKWKDKKYEEADDVTKKIPEMIQKFLDQKEKSGLYKQIKILDSKAQRTPEFLQFIKDHDSYGEKRETIVLDIEINEPPYVGSFPVLFYTFSDGETWYGKTAIQHPLAVNSKTIYYLKLDPSVHTVEEFNQWLQRSVNDPKLLQSAQRDYVEYLKSFAFLEEQQNTEKEQLNEILSLFQSRSMDTNFFRTKLIQKGYIRPSKKQKQQGAGMVPQSGIKIVVDKEKIKDDIFKDGNHYNSPDFFYAAIAYVIHRHQDANIGFMPVEIQQAVTQTIKNFNRYNVQIPYQDMYDYIDELAKKLLKEILNIEARGSSWDEYVNFKNWSTNGTDKSRGGFSPGLSAFITFATIHGVSPELAAYSPKDVYRQLALKLHPDRNPGKNSEDFIRLQSLWDDIKEQYRSAKLNWWIKLCFRGTNVVN